MEEAVHSPCTNRCYVPPGTDICTGCYRTIKEIIDWLNFTHDERKKVLKKIENRIKENEKIG